MKFIDMHCDTGSRMLYEKKGLLKSDLKVDIEKLKKGDSLAQYFAFFIDKKEVKSPYEEFIKMYDNFIKEISLNKENIKLVKDYKDIKSLDKTIGAFLTIEEGEVLEGDIKRVKEMKERGIGAITLTWNYENSIGYPNFKEEFINKGLKERGKEIVLEMEKQNIIPDASHLSDGGFYDLIDILKKPFIASHSNARSIVNHRRNMTDDMIRALSNKGGVMGLNFCSAFCKPNGVNSIKEITTIEEIINHAKYIKNIGGIEVLGLGSDFDGIENEVQINDISKMDKLFYELKKVGFTESEIEKVFYKNILRVMKEYGGR
ncbi:dipeptidase [Clostridium chrysemydis]|uniref:dipeptidase n=1 Tax=Clostridium chrysemydis TaxID=2665504 RepID=UPI001883FAF1|nr:dipeptidase [Clostridium chrysemydis]